MSKTRKINPVKQGGMAFKQGRTYIKDGVRVLIGNPHAPNTDENRGWELGYGQAYFSNLAKVKKYEARAGG